LAQVIGDKVIALALTDAHRIGQLCSVVIIIPETIPRLCHSKSLAACTLDWLLVAMCYLLLLVKQQCLMTAVPLGSKDAEATFPNEWLEPFERDHLVAALQQVFCHCHKPITIRRLDRMSSNMRINSELVMFRIFFAIKHQWEATSRT
jgi:hypothetical protein